MLLHYKTILITGATRGIGKATATLFASQGANLILLARNISLLTELKTFLEEKFAITVSVYSCDVGLSAEVKTVFADLRSKKISLDVVVNNAGIMLDAMLTMTSEDMIHNTYSTNVFGTMFVTQQAAKFMIKNRKGSIINLSSIVGTNGSKGQTVYASSKSAIIGFTKSLAKELAPFNIRVNAIAPGFIQTDMTAGRDDKFYEQNTAMIGMGRMGKAEDIANTALYLASDLSEYVTGQIIGVDGGFLI